MPNFQAVVRRIVDEGPGARTLHLDPGEPFDYRAGQFISIDPHAIPALAPIAAELEARKGRKERPRAYSLASAPHEPGLAICVKEEASGAFPSLLSPYLARSVRVGDSLPCSGFNGLYVVPRELPEGAHVVHLCAGSGIVPNFGMVKALLHEGRAVRQTLVHSNRTLADALYAGPLQRLAEAHPERLRLVHTVTRVESPPPGIRQGRIDAALIRELVPDLENAWFYVCGPSIPEHERREARLAGTTLSPRFLESVRALLLGLGVTKDRLNTEGW